MAGSVLAKIFDPKLMADRADWLAVAAAVSVPWSTSATSILIVIWVLALAPTLKWPDVRRELLTAAGGLPVLLFLLGALGMIWAGVPWEARLGGLNSFAKLLVVPLLIVQFRRSDKGEWVLIGFLIACVALLIASYAGVVIAWYWLKSPGAIHVLSVLVKSYIIQSAEFAICAAVLFDIAVTSAIARRWFVAIGAVLLGVAFVGNIVFFVTGRTTLVILPVLAVIYGVRRFGWKGLFAVFALGAVMAAMAWTMSPYLRFRVESTFTQTRAYETEDAATSTGKRLMYWTKSLEFIESAPVLGHGTGSIPAMFRQAAVGQTGVAGEVSTNPHNMTFAVAIQIGLVGALVLWAMWITQLSLFRGPGLVAWIGLVLVVQNLVGSLFNS
ncbi:MAG: O-antigen ligase family protein, partial [Gammaproteobacteria bacterium]